MVGKVVAVLEMHLLPRPVSEEEEVVVVRGRKWYFGLTICRQASRSRLAQAEAPQAAVALPVVERLVRLVVIPHSVDSSRHMAAVAAKAAPMQLRRLAVAVADRPAQALQVVVRLQSQEVIPEIQIQHQLLVGRVQDLEVMRNTEAEVVAALQIRRAVTRCKTAEARCLAALEVPAEEGLIRAMFAW